MEAVFGKDGDNNRKKSYNIESGIMGSEMEARVLDQLFNIKNTKALSAIRILSIANEQQIPIYTINSSNIAQRLPLLQISDDVKSAIECAVNRGMEVIIPGSNITYNEVEVIGYIAINPETGEGAYMVEGIGGGWLAWTKAILQILLIVVLIVAIALLIGPVIVGFLSAIAGFIAQIATALASIFLVIGYCDSFTKGAEQFFAILQELIVTYGPIILSFITTYGPSITQLIGVAVLLGLHLLLSIHKTLFGVFPK